MKSYVIGYGIASAFLCGPGLLGFVAGVLRWPRVLAPAVASVPALIVLAFMCWVWIQADGPCYHECWDEDAIARYIAGVTLLWWSLAAGSAYLLHIAGDVLVHRDG